MEDFHVTCEQGVGDGHVAQVADGVFSGLVLLQQLQTSAAHGDDHEAFVRDIYSAAGKLKMAEELGFVTSLAGMDPPDKAIAALGLISPSSLDCPPPSPPPPPSFSLWLLSTAPHSGISEVYWHAKNNINGGILHM